MAEEKKITLYDEDIYENVAPKEETREFVVIRVLLEWYAVEAARVRAITKVEKITFVPGAPESIAGIMNLRGDIVSVTNLKKLLAASDEGITEKSRLVVIESGNCQTALLADEVDEVTDVPTRKIDPVLAALPPGRAEYLEGEFRLEDKLVGILKTEKILVVRGG